MCSVCVCKEALLGKCCIGSLAPPVRTHTHTPTHAQGETLTTLKKLVSEVASLFPDEFIHLGCDETKEVGPCTRDCKCCVYSTHHSTLTLCLTSLPYPFQPFPFISFPSPPPSPPTRPHHSIFPTLILPLFPFHFCLLFPISPLLLPLLSPSSFPPSPSPPCSTSSLPFFLLHPPPTSCSPSSLSPSSLLPLSLLPPPSLPPPSSLSPSSLPLLPLSLLPPPSSLSPSSLPLLPPPPPSPPSPSSLPLLPLSLPPAAIQALEIELFKHAKSIGKTPIGWEEVLFTSGVVSAPAIHNYVVLCMFGRGG